MCGINQTNSIITVKSKMGKMIMYLKHGGRRCTKLPTKVNLYNSAKISSSASVNDGLSRNQLVIRGLLWCSKNLSKGRLLTPFCLRDNLHITNHSSIRLRTTISDGGSCSSPWSCMWGWGLFTCWRSTCMGDTFNLGRIRG